MACQSKRDIKKELRNRFQDLSRTRFCKGASVAGSREDANGVHAGLLPHLHVQRVIFDHDGAVRVYVQGREGRQKVVGIKGARGEVPVFGDQPIPLVSSIS